MFVRTLALAVGFLFALIGVQGPEFAQQYRQRLAGAIDELRREVAEFDAEARSHALSRDEAVKRLETNSDPLAHDRGVAAQADATRLSRLEDAFSALKDEAPLRRLVTFVEDYDPEIAARTFHDFEPAAPTTTEAFVIGGATGLVGWALTHLGAWPVRRRLGKKPARI
jgi:hypothetical protein